MSDVEEFWESFYAEGKSRWSGKPNASLVAEVSELPPGTALDLGCGQGGDAIWLAAKGWRVTGADVSARALATAARHAAEAGVGEAIVWERHDLAASLPTGPFDLVSAAYLHSPVELPRGEVLRRAAEAVAPGGQLLVVGHAPSASHPHADLPSLDEVIEQLALDDAEWSVLTSELRTIEHRFSDEEAPKERTDTVLRVQRADG